MTATPSKATDIIAIVDRLPMEILENIFAFGYATTSTFYQSWNRPTRAQAATRTSIYRSETLPFQWLLTSVCRRWRAIVLEKPWAWTTVPLELMSSPEFMAEYLQRSRDLPLHIHFEADEHYSDLPISGQLGEILDVLLTAKDRWRRLIVASVWMQPLVQMTSYLQHLYVPALEFCGFCFCDPETYDPRLSELYASTLLGPQQLFLGGAPKLTEMRIDCGRTFPHLQDETYQQLTTLCVQPYTYLHGTRVPTLHLLAAHATALTSLTLFRSRHSGWRAGGCPEGDLDTAWRGAGVFLFSTLRTLHLTRSQDVVLDMLSAPALEVLQIDDLFHHQWRVVAYMARLLANPGRYRLPGELMPGVSRFNRVRTLRVGVARGKMLVVSAIAAVYGLFPELQTLVLKGLGEPDLVQLLEPLTPTVYVDFDPESPLDDPTTSVKAENLEHLVLLGEWHFCDVADALIPLINWRLDTDRPLKKLTLERMNGMVRDCCPSFSEMTAMFEAAGVECEVLDPNDVDAMQEHWIQYPREQPAGIP